jgi:dolichol-phosphate mannosyltransferase
MDCDFAHTPGYIPGFLSRTDQYDVVVGSRYLQERSLAEWSLFRKGLTLMGHMATKAILRMSYDATGAFRAYRLDKIPYEVFDLVRSTSYSFFFESIYALHKNGFRICEIPIVLPSRTYGHSKMRIVDVVASIFWLFKIAGTQIVHKSRYRVNQEHQRRNRNG